MATFKFLKSLGLSQIAESVRESKNAYHQALFENIKRQTRESRIALRDAKDAMIAAHNELQEELAARKAIRARK